MQHLCQQAVMWSNEQRPLKKLSQIYCKAWWLSALIFNLHFLVLLNIYLIFKIKGLGLFSNSCLPTFFVQGQKCVRISSNLPDMLILSAWSSHLQTEKCPAALLYFYEIQQIKVIVKFREQRKHAFIFSKSLQTRSSSWWFLGVLRFFLNSDIYILI